MRSIVKEGPTFVLRKAWKTALHPVFGVLTICGNGVIALAAAGLYHLEYGVNPAITSPTDAIWWAVTTVTTVGYGDIVPITTAGRWLAIATMILGTTFFWAFTALFTATLLEPELTQVEREMRGVEHTVEKMNLKMKREAVTLGDVTRQLEGLLAELKRMERG